MGLPAEQLDNAAQTSRTRPRVGGGGGKQIPFLVDTKLLGDPPPSPARADRRAEMQAILTDLGVRKAYILARDYPPEHIEGWVATWQEDRDGGADIGPGALAVRIEQWGPPPAPRAASQDGGQEEADWFEERYKRGGKGTLR